MTVVTGSGSLGEYVFILMIRDGGVYVVTSQPTDTRLDRSGPPTGLQELPARTVALAAGSACRRSNQFGHGRKDRRRNADDFVSALDRCRRAFGLDAG